MLCELGFVPGVELAMRDAPNLYPKAQIVVQSAVLCITYTVTPIWPWVHCTHTQTEYDRTGSGFLALAPRAECACSVGFGLSSWLLRCSKFLVSRVERCLRFAYSLPKQSVVYVFVCMCVCEWAFRVWDWVGLILMSRLPKECLCLMMCDDVRGDFKFGLRVFV